MSKFIPTAQDLSICLRCQYRLSLRQACRARRQRHIRYPQQLRSFTSGSKPRQEELSSHDPGTDNGNLETPIRYYTEDLNRNQNNRHGNEPSTKDRLGLDVLGEPAEVLILRDRQNNFRLDSSMAQVRASGPDKNPPQEPTSSSGMLKEMDAERGIIDIDEVCRNIESVRASWVARKRGGSTGVAYKDLFSRLHEGFTKQQLGAYLDRAGSDPAADIFDLNVDFSNDLYARSSWQLAGKMLPKKSRAPQISNDSPKIESKRKEELPGKQRRQKLSKNELVKSILRQCWNITPKFQESSLGSMDMRLKKLHLKLILNHKRDILKLISRSYDSKVEAWPQDETIRITSDYHNCVDIFKLLIQTLSNIRVSTIDLDDHSVSDKDFSPFPGKLNSAMLRQFEEYTNTLIGSHDISQVEASNKKLRVLYLGPDDADLLETQRLIHQILRPDSRRKVKLAWWKETEKSNVRPAPVEVGSRFSLLDRNQQWSRWCIPATKSPSKRIKQKDRTPPSTSSAGLSAQSLHSKPEFDTVKSFFGAPDDTSYKLYNSITPCWRPEIEYHDSVKFGQVLFPTDKTSIVGNKLEERYQKSKTNNPARKKRPLVMRDVGFQSSKIRREFVALVPGLVRSLESLGSLDKSEEFLLLRLSPSSKNLSLPVPVEALPDLEIRISLDSASNTISIKDARLLNRREMDFMQPQNVVDLHFIRNQCVYAKEDNIDPRIVSFVEDSSFDIWGTEPFKMPLGLSLSIPALAIQPHAGFDPTAYQTLLVDYISLRLEHTSSLSIPYETSDSWPTLTYTTIEAGPIGGRRDELSLHNLRFASEQLPLTDPESSPASIEDEFLSDNDHTSILFHKLASLADTIEHGDARRDGKPRLRMPELRRWRRVKKNTVRKIEYPTARDGQGYLPPVNETVRRVVSDRLARPIGADGGRGIAAREEVAVSDGV